MPSESTAAPLTFDLRARTGPDGDPFPAKVRDAIVSRKPRLEEACPEAVDLASEVLVLGHRILAGRVETLGSLIGRAGDVLRRIFRGEEKSLTLEDLSALCITAPQQAASILTLLVARTGHVVVPADSLPLTGPELTAQTAIKGGALLAALARALENDGQIDADEARALLPLKASLVRVLHRIDAIAAGRE